MLAVEAGELTFTDKICGEQAYWIWEPEDDFWGNIRHKVHNRNTQHFKQIAV